MSKKLLAFSLVLLLFIFSGCENNNEDSNTEVKGLTLKITLFTVADDVNRANYKNTDVFTEDLYKQLGESEFQYYQWLKTTYDTMDEEMRNRLIRIFDRYSSVSFVGEVISLKDECGVDELVQKINNSTLSLSDELKEDVEVFFSYFYEEYLKELMEANKKSIDKNAKELNSFIRKNNVDILKFMEEESGIQFKDYEKVVFYFDLPPVGASGYSYDGYKVSTIQPNMTENALLGTPFHEFSHELFRTFTRGGKFSEVAEELKSNKDLTDGFEKIGKYSYNWIGWCEENLVEGFADYLTYKYNGEKSTNNIYVYDLEFFNYLVDNNFNPSNLTLEDASIEFYKKLLD